MTYASIFLVAMLACALMVEPRWLMVGCMGALTLFTCLAFLASPTGTGHVLEFAVVLVIASALLIGGACYVKPLLLQ